MGKSSPRHTRASDIRLALRQHASLHARRHAEVAQATDYRLPNNQLPPPFDSLVFIGAAQAGTAQDSVIEIVGIADAGMTNVNVLLLV